MVKKFNENSSVDPSEYGEIAAKCVPSFLELLKKSL